MISKPEGPKGLPLLGSMPELARDSLAFYQRLQREYGGIAHANLSIYSIYYLADPLLVEEVLVGKHRESVKDRITRLLIPLVGHSILTTDGEPWRKRRKLSAQAFAPKHIAAYADTMVACAQAHVAHYRDGEQRDFHRDTMALTLEVVGKTILGFDPHGEAERIAHALDEAIPYFEGLMFSLSGQLARLLPTPNRIRFARAKRELDAVVAKVVARAQAQRDTASFLLARLAAARDEQGASLSPEELANEAITYLLAGHETTALTILYVVYLLSTHPDIAMRVRAELDLLGDRPVTLADLERLPLLRAVLKETMRLYPPAPVFAREVAVPFYLNGYELPRGAQIVFSPYAMQRDPRYFPEPDHFKPDRFLDGSTEQLPKLAYFPFGAGPRVCIGQHFSLMEAELLLATLLQHVELSVEPGFKMELQPVITMRSRHGLPVRVRQRRAVRYSEPVEAAQ